MQEENASPRVEPWGRRYGSSGLLVVCLHGGPGAPGELAPVAQRLSTAFRVLEPFERRSGTLTLNLQVHVDDLARLVRETGSQKAALLGFSSGAITALAFASMYPELASTVVLVGTATLTTEARAEFKRRLSERLDAVTARRLAELGARPDTDERLEAQAALVTQAYLVDPLVLPEHVWVDARGHHDTWRDMLRLQESGEHPESFRSISCSLLMIHGREDPHPGEIIRRSLHAVVPQLEYTELAGCGHYPWLERSAREEFYAVLERWLKNHATASHASYGGLRL